MPDFNAQARELLDNLKGYGRMVLDEKPDEDRASAALKSAYEAGATGALDAVVSEVRYRRMYEHAAGPILEIVAAVRALPLVEEAGRR
jgi:hypothetical protein